MRWKFVFTLVLLAVFFQPAFGVFSWLFGTDEEPVEETEVVDVVRTRKDLVLKTLKEVEKSLVNFDFGTDLKYVSDATRNELEKFSAIDNCHQSLVMRISNSCGRLNEEDLGKLAVQLLNCQLANEGRETYDCSDDMSLKQCTKDMSPTVWNAYQIVGNRARSVCSSAKQQQFRIKTEMAVNQLMHSTVGQLRAMEQIKEGQQELGEATADTIKKMYEGQEELMNRQELLKSSHNDVQHFVAENLKALTKEKSLIANGNLELARMTESIKLKLDQATSQLEEQKKDRAQNHGELVNDLAVIRNKAKDVWDKIDANTKHLMLYHDKTTAQYQRTMENLQRLNTTVSFILNSVHSLKTGIDARFGWLTTLVSGSQEQITVIYVIVLHAGYFILAAILASFLQTELFTRTVIMVIVPLNCVAAVKHGIALDFLALSSFVLLIIAVQWLVHVLYAFVGSAPMTSSTPDQSSPVKPGYGEKMCHPTPMVPAKHSLQQSGLSKKDLAKIATALRDVLSERKRHSSSTPLDLSCDSALDSSFLNDDPVVFDAATPVPEDPTFYSLDDRVPDNDLNTTETLNQVKSKLMNGLHFEPTVKMSRSLPQSPARTPTKQPNSFMSLGVMTPNRMLCSSFTKAGKRCKKFCMSGLDVCSTHSNNASIDVTNSTFTTNHDSTVNSTFAPSDNSTVIVN